ncbi:AAA family ATPase [Sphingomonas sp. AP4-R1]|uniref:AAA family ATPase n=1 Tax=Sphingomonas sp. AP4-R1 TaxID=2735134 RepID=UPI001493592D|nr:AAA family ATPase [Sphingomonas sp. AP4-R1]QJU56830.1 AAA family ATPase [Sphingomonas sp. AP4-R1]
MSMVSQAVSSFDDLLGGDSPLDRSVTITIFADELAQRKSERQISLRQFAQEVHDPSARAKADLPLMKLARFGNVSTTKGSLRNNDNVLEIEGIEGDYDGGLVGVADAAAWLRNANIAALIYSSPSHTPDKPRFRVVCPLGSSTAPEQRERLCARLNGALGGILSGESFTLSQSYYFGHVKGASAPEVAIVEGRPLDAANDLDAAAIGRHGTPYSPSPAPLVTAVSAPDGDDDELDWQPAPDWDRIESALSAIPVKDADHQDTGGRDLWLRIGQALHQVSGGSDDGFDRWDAWSKDGEKYNRRDQERTWKSLGRRDGKRVRIGTLFDLAKRYGWSQSSAPGEPDVIDQIGFAASEQAAATAPTALRFLPPSACADTPSRGYVVKGLFAPRDLACIFGAPGAGKSLIAPHIGYQAALGRTAFGMRTKPGCVFYVAAEDPHGMRGRVTGLRRRHGDAPDFILVEGVSDLLASGSPDLAALRSAVAEQRPSLIFLDTLAMSFPGLEENTAEDMGRVVAIARSLTGHGAAVVLIHHDTKAQGATPRGHSLLNGALDVGLQLFARDEAGIVRGKLTKNRNGSCDRDIAFRIATECLGEDEDGDAITTALVDELAPGAAPKREKLTPSERAALQIFEALSTAGAVTEDAWRKACVASATVSASADADSRRKAAKRAFEGLARKGAVLMEGGLVRRPTSLENAFDQEEVD